jgi:hypothetical protein
VNHGSHNGKLNSTEEKWIEEALKERSAVGEKIDRQLVQIVIRQMRLERRGGLGGEVSALHCQPDRRPG